MYKLGLEMAEEPETKLPTFVWSERKQGNSRKTSTSGSLTMLKPLTVDHNKLWKILKEIGIQDHLTCVLRNLYAGQEAKVRTRHGTMNRLKLGKEYVKAVYCHLAFLTYMQSTSWDRPGWMNLNLKSRLPGEISIISALQMDDITLMAEEKRN